MGPGAALGGRRALVVCVCALLLLLQSAKPGVLRRSLPPRGCAAVASHVEPAASSPALALYFFLTADVLLRGWPIDLLLGTLAANPHLSVFVLIDDESTTPAMQVSPASVAAELARACRCREQNLVFLHTSALNSSRSHSMRPFHDGMFPPEQTQGRIRMFARFCYQADLAKQLGHNRILTLDSDIVLLEDVAYLVDAYSQDVVSPADWTSQFVLWTQPGLDAFCDAIHAHFGWNQSTFMARSRMYPLDDVWNDMYFLRWWLDDPSSQHFSRHLFLPGFHLASPYNASTSGPDLKWLAAADFNIFGRGCGNASDVVCLAGNQSGASQLQPRKFCSTGDALGGLHFQGDVCKSRARGFIRELYQRQGNGSQNRCMSQL